MLVRRIDAFERAAGYKPPMFVDIRFSRSVRAIGFRDKAFEQQLGHTRYRWMRSLGNASIGTKPRKIKIQCPDAAHQLLDLAIDAVAANKRIIYFCSCPSSHGAEYCHRTHVAKLLARAARARGVRVGIEEWPGGAPSRTAVTLREQRRDPSSSQRCRGRHAHAAPGRRTARRSALGHARDFLASGMSQEEILRDYPQLTVDDIRVCLAYASEMTRERTFHVA